MYQNAWEQGTAASCSRYENQCGKVCLTLLSVPQAVTPVCMSTTCLVTIKEASQGQAPYDHLMYTPVPNRSRMHTCLNLPH